MKIRHPERYEEWAIVIAEWKETGLSIAEFCRQRDIKREKFFAWKRRLADRELEGSKPAGFVAVEFEDEAGGCGIGVCVGGVELQLSKGFDEQELLRAVRALRRNAC